MMECLRTNWQAIDRRAGYQRQADEPVEIICECGAIVAQRFGELHHVDDCPACGDPRYQRKSATP